MTFTLLLLGKFKNLRFCHPVAGVILQNFHITFLHKNTVCLVLVPFHHLPCYLVGTSLFDLLQLLGRYFHLLFHSLVDKCFKFQGIVFFAQSGTLLVHLVDIFIPSLCFFFQFFDSPQQPLGDGQSGNGFSQRFNDLLYNQVLYTLFRKSVSLVEYAEFRLF